MVILGQEISGRIEYSAKIPPDQRTRDLYQNPQSYAFVHYFRVSYKKPNFQILPEKVEVTIKSDSPHAPSEDTVTIEFQKLILMVGKTTSEIKGKNEVNAYNITKIEYRYSIATHAH